MFHLNIRSFQKHLDSLKELLHQLSTPPDVICITESKLKDGFSCSVSIPDYNFFYANSPTNAGGVAIYVNKDLDAKLENDYQFQMVGCENLFLSLKIGNKKFIVGAVYKHPDANKILFLERLEEKLQLINLLQLNCAVLGDFNINLLSSDSSIIAYNNMLTSNSFFHIISVPTRVTKSSATLIDHILTNSLHSNITPGVVRYDTVIIFLYMPFFPTFQKNKLPKSIIERILEITIMKT